MKVQDRNSNDAGAVLVFALLLLIVAGVVLGGISQLAATRSLVSAGEWEEARQRIIVGNSRAMARSFLLQNMFFTNVPTNVFSATTSQGGFVLTNTTTNFWTASSPTGVSQIVNPFNAMERGGFYPTTIRAGLWDGSTNVDGSPNTSNNIAWNFQVRTRSPIAAGLSLVCHNGDIDSPHTNASQPYFHGNNVLGLTNMASSPLTSATSGTNGYGGNRLEAPVPAVADSLTYTNVSFQSFGGNWSAVVDLTAAAGTVNPTNPSVIFKYVVPITNGANPGFVTRVILQGATNAASNPAVLIVAEGSNTQLTNLILTNNNTRRVYFIRQRDLDVVPGLVVSATNATNWTLGMTVAMHKNGSWMRRNLQFSNAVSLQVIRGGVRTDAEILSPPSFTNEPDPAGLDYIGDLIMWLEDRRAQ